MNRLAEEASYFSAYESGVESERERCVEMCKALHDTSDAGSTCGLSHKELIKLVIHKILHPN
jgi:hypothetical protein